MLNSPSLSRADILTKLESILPWWFTTYEKLIVQGINCGAAAPVVFFGQQRLASLSTQQRRRRGLKGQFMTLVRDENRLDQGR